MQARLLARLDRAPLLVYRRRQKTPWSVGWIPSRTVDWVNAFSPDIVHLHWINGGMLSIGGIARIQRPIVWTLHDFWAFTGGCHYPYECLHYEHACGRCPQLGSKNESDLSRMLFRQKEKRWHGLNLTLVSPSKWLAEKAARSSLLGGRRIEVIPNALDTTIFKPVNRQDARRLLNLPEEGKLVLFGALNALKDRRKGFLQLDQALQLLATRTTTPPPSLVVFGASPNDCSMKLPLRSYFLGAIRDESLMSAVYSAADVFVLPSLSDNLPCTIAEALACGTPCVGFRVGGVPEMIEHLQTGFLAESGNAEELAAGIQFVLGSKEAWPRMSDNARATACGKYAMAEIARRHASLYSEILSRRMPIPSQPSLQPKA